MVAVWSHVDGWDFYYSLMSWVEVIFRQFSTLKTSVTTLLILPVCFVTVGRAFDFSLSDIDLAIKYFLLDRICFLECTAEKKINQFLYLRQRLGWEGLFLSFLALGLHQLQCLISQLCIHHTCLALNPPPPTPGEKSGAHWRAFLWAQMWFTPVAVKSSFSCFGFYIQ